MNIVKTWGTKRKGRSTKALPRAVASDGAIDVHLAPGSPFNKGDIVALHLLENEKFVLAPVRNGYRVCLVSKEVETLKVKIRGLTCDEDVQGVVVDGLIEFPPHSFKEIETIRLTN